MARDAVRGGPLLRTSPSLSLACAALLLACRPPSISEPAEPPPVGGDSAPWDSGDSPVPGETGDSDPGGETGETGEPFVDPACDALPEPPFEWRNVEAYSLEDLDFDQEGHLIGNNGQHIYKSSYDGEAEVWVANLPFEAGMRMLPTGELVVCLDTRGAIVLVHEDGSYETLVGDLSYPNGLEIGRDGRIYVAESSGDRVRRIDPETGESLVLTQGQIDAPEGLSFSPDFTTLYINSYSSSARRIYKLPMDENGDPAGELEVFAEDVGTGYLVGMGVDICGNLYVIDYSRAKVMRYNSDGEYLDTVFSGQDIGNHAYLPNLKWGSGLGGWSAHKLYVVDAQTRNNTYEVDIGVRSKQW